ncbi:MAG: hypothetical protein PHH58_10215 [Rhodoferax sp.]|nr:hypothetical protein [Rhodoferax sp.]
MANLNTRLETLEKCTGVSGQRPQGMSDAQFLRYLSEMQRPEHALFLKAISHDDLDAIVKHGIRELADSMVPAEYEKFMSAYESGNLRASIAILKQDIEGTHHDNT